MTKVYYQRTDGYPICQGCIRFNKYYNCYMKDTGTSLYPLSCEHFAKPERCTKDLTAQGKNQAHHKGSKNAKNIDSM